MSIALSTPSSPNRAEIAALIAARADCAAASSMLGATLANRRAARESLAADVASSSPSDQNHLLSLLRVHEDREREAAAAVAQVQADAAAVEDALNALVRRHSSEQLATLEATLYSTALEHERRRASAAILRQWRAWHVHHGNDARRRWRAKRAYSYWLRCVELRAIDRIWIFARRRRLWQRAMRAWRNGALGMAFTYWLDARLAGSNRRALAAAALLFRHGRSVKLALLCWQDLVGAKLMLATANAAPKVRSLLNALRRSFALMARLGRIHHLVLLLLDRTYRREMRRGLAALAVGLSDWRRLGLRPFGRASIRRRIHASNAPR